MGVVRRFSPNQPFAGILGVERTRGVAIAEGE